MAKSSDVDKVPVYNGGIITLLQQLPNLHCVQHEIYRYGLDC